jgi:hypothetical protein
MSIPDSQAPSHSGQSLLDPRPNQIRRPIADKSKS